MFEDKLSLAILIVFAVIAFIELLYYYLVFARFAFRRKRKNNARSTEQVPVSVIMVVQDMASTLLKTMPRLLNQQYEKFELVVVNNNSQDETPMLLLEYSSQYSNIKVVNLDSAVTSIRGRKFAISMGIRCASYEHLIFTDAECAPTSSHWLEQMAGNFASGAKIVLGYSSYEKRRNPFNRLLHFDNMFSAMQYFGHAVIGSTYRGDSKNIGFDKELFYAQRGFAAHNHICYGDEDIFISRAARKARTAIAFGPGAFTVLQRSAYHKYWRHHKEGLYFTRKFNTMKNRILLGGYDLVNLLFYVVLACAIVCSLKDIVLLSIVLSIAFVRVLSQYLVFGFAASKLGEKQVIPMILIYDIIFAIINPLYILSARLNARKFM